MSASSGAEGNTGHTDITVTTVTPTSSGSNVPHDICFSGTATLDADGGTRGAGDDYQLLDGSTVLGSLHITSSGCHVLFSGPGVTQTRTIRVFGDTTKEEDETIIVTVTENALSALPPDVTLPTSGNPHTYTVTDDDRPVVSFPTGTGASAIVDEGEAATLTLNVAPAQSAAFDVNLRAVDLTGAFGQADRLFTVTVPANAATHQFTVATADDNLDEAPNQLGRVTLQSGGTVYKFSQSTRNFDIIVQDDDDTAVTLSVSGSGAASEGGAALTLTATLSRAHDESGPLSIPIRVRAKGTTAQASDYTLAGTIEVPFSGTTGTTTFAVVDDSDHEYEETVVVELGTLPAHFAPGDPDSVTITIADNDPGVFFSATEYEAEEGRDVIVTLELNIPQTTVISVALSCTAGTAESGDYNCSAVQTVPIPAGDSSRTFRIFTSQDTDTEDDDFTIAITAVQGAPAIGSPSSATVTVREIDTSLELVPGLSSPLIHMDFLPSPGVTGSGGAWSLEEGTSFNVRFSNLAEHLHGQDLTVNYYVAERNKATGTPAAQHIPDGHGGLRSVTLPANQRSVTVTVPTQASTLMELDALVQVFAFGPTPDEEGTYISNSRQPLNFTVRDGTDGAAAFHPEVQVGQWGQQRVDGGVAEGRRVLFQVKSQSASPVPYTVRLKVEETGGDCVAAGEERVRTHGVAPRDPPPAQGGATGGGGPAAPAVTG
ncbi:MAG: hypothetical protein OXP08_00495, partial [bacterium]|nr:hypothetical protein [bacterium]